jgi:hypothetical protein
VLDEARCLRPRPRCALVLGRMDERRGLDRAAPDLLAGAFAVPVLTVRQDSALAAALNAGGLPPATGRAAADLEAVADEGTEALQKAWKASDAALRDHLTKTSGKRWDAIKSKAAKAPQAVGA